MAALVRLLIQTAITTGIWVGVDSIIIPYLKKWVHEYQVGQGMTEEEAKDSVANDVIDIIEVFGVVAVSIKSKFPTKAAEYLGFTSKGWVRRVVIKKVVTKEAAIILPAAIIGKGAISASAATATEIVNKAIVTKAGFKTFYDLSIKTLGVAVLAAMTIGNWIDFGNWGQGAYQSTFQKIFAKISFGLLVPDEDYRKSLTVSSEVFDKVYETYKIEGATHINDPFKSQTVEFTRDNLLDLTDKVGAKLLSTKGRAGVKDVLFVTQTMIVFTGIAGGGTLGWVGTSQDGLSTGAGTSLLTPKVFTGIVSQGVIGRGLEFVPRQDDLIESAEELKIAAANNLAPFLQSLIGKIIYEVKIVSSVMTKDGFKQTGTVQQIRNGVTATGAPKYRTVVNKFAQLNLYILTDRGVRTKITTVTLGPTDSAKFTVGVNDIKSIESAIPELVFTKDINEITGIETINSVTVSTPAAASGTSAPAPLTGPVVTSAAVASTQRPTALVVGINALTLFDWFGARGRAVPPMEERAATYARYGLGNAAYYSGTVEQNTKLLNLYKNIAAAELVGAIAINAEDDAPEGSRIEKIAGQLYMFKVLPSDGATGKSKEVAKSADVGGNGKSITPPKTGEADETGKIVKGWTKRKNGDVEVRYRDKSKRTIKRKK